MNLVTTGALAAFLKMIWLRVLAETWPRLDIRRLATVSTGWKTISSAIPGASVRVACAWEERQLDQQNRTSNAC